MSELLPADAKDAAAGRRHHLIQGSPLSPLGLAALMAAWLKGVCKLGAPAPLGTCIYYDDRVHRAAGDGVIRDMKQFLDAAKIMDGRLGVCPEPGQVRRRRYHRGVAERNEPSPRHPQGQAERQHQAPRDTARPEAPKAGEVRQGHRGGSREAVQAIAVVGRDPAQRESISQE